MKLKADEKLVNPNGTSTPFLKQLHQVVEAGSADKGKNMECVRLGHKIAVVEEDATIEFSDDELKLIKGCMDNPMVILPPRLEHSFQCLLWPSKVAESDMAIFNHWQEAAKESK